MCIIIDTNTLPAVFDIDSANHADFSPILEWIKNGRGKIIYGGTKYERELRKYLKLFAEFRRIGKGIHIDSDVVDAKEAEISQVVVDPDFDDQHLVALLMVSKCKVICSLDERAYPFFRHSAFFSPARNRPRIYNQFNRRDLLCNENIVDICR